MKNLLIFLSGVVVGVVGLMLYEMFGVAVEPSEDYGLLFDDYPVLSDDVIKSAKNRLIRHRDSRADTQPIQVERS